MHTSAPCHFLQAPNICSKRTRQMDFRTEGGPSEETKEEDKEGVGASCSLCAEGAGGGSGAQPEDSGRFAAYEHMRGERRV